MTLVRLPSSSTFVALARQDNFSGKKRRVSDSFLSPRQNLCFNFDLPIKTAGSYNSPQECFVHSFLCLKIKYMERRRFLKISAAAGLTLAAGPVNFLEHATAFAQPTKKIFDIVGINDTPVPDGSKRKNLDSVLYDLDKLQTKSILVIEPEADYITALEASGIKVYARIFMPQNRFDRDHINQALGKLPANTKVQFFNEVNNTAEINHPGTPKDALFGRSPQEHILKDVLPAYDLMVSKGKGFRLLLTPIDQFAQPMVTAEGVFTPEDFQRQNVKILKGEIGTQVFLDTVETTAHEYFFRLGEKPLGNWIRTIDKINREELGSQVNIPVTEAGVHPSAQAELIKTFGQITARHALADDLITQLNTEIDPALPVPDYLYWLLSNLDKRDLKDAASEEVRSFEVAALRQRFGRVTKVYDSWASYARNQVILSQYRNGKFIAI